MTKPSYSLVKVTCPHMAAAQSGEVPSSPNSLTDPGSASITRRTPFSSPEAAKAVSIKARESLAVGCTDHSVCISAIDMRLSPGSHKRSAWSTDICPACSCDIWKQFYHYIVDAATCVRSTISASLDWLQLFGHGPVYMAGSFSSMSRPPAVQFHQHDPTSVNCEHLWTLNMYDTGKDTRVLIEKRETHRKTLLGGFQIISISAPFSPLPCRRKGSTGLHWSQSKGCRPSLPETYTLSKVVWWMVGTVQSKPGRLNMDKYGKCNVNCW